jgi:hypothetical protein
VPQAPQHPDFILEVCTKLSCYDWIEYLLQCTWSTSPSRIVYSTKTTLSYLTTHLDFIERENWQSIILCRIAFGFSQPLCQALDFLLQPLDFAVPIGCPSATLCIEIGIHGRPSPTSDITKRSIRICIV